MDGQPNIHFVNAQSFEESERKVNDWIDNLPYLCTVLNVNVLPMLLENKLNFLAVIMYTKQPNYVPSSPMV